MLDKRMKRRTYLFCFDLSVPSIAAAKDSQLPDNYDDLQGDLVPDDLLEGDGKVCVRSAIVRWRVHKAEPGVLSGKKLAASASLPE